VSLLGLAIPAVLEKRGKFCADHGVAAATPQFRGLCHCERGATRGDWEYLRGVPAQMISPRVVQRSTASTPCDDRCCGAPVDHLHDSSIASDLHGFFHRYVAYLCVGGLTRISCSIRALHPFLSL